MSESIELRRELRIIAKQMQDMRIEASCLFNAADHIEKLEAALLAVKLTSVDFVAVTIAVEALEGKDESI